MKKIRIDTHIVDKITQSSQIENSMKITFLRYLGYMTISEQRELSGLL